MKKSLYLLLLVFLAFSCENRDINEGEEFRPREVSEDFQQFHFNRIVYDGVEYLITERDNNNPHEGFGFMAFGGNRMASELDSLMAYVKANGEMQSRIYARISGISDAASDSLYLSLFRYYLQQEKAQSEARLQQVLLEQSQEDAADDSQ